MAKNKGGLTKGQKFTLRILGKYLAPVALCLVVLIASLVFAGSLSSGQEALIVTDDNQIGELRNKLDALDNDIKAMGETDGYSTEWVYSRNDERKAADDAVAEAFFKEYPTWTNGEEYEQKHKALVSACGGYSTSSLVISSSPISWMGRIEPISLLAYMMVTRAVSSRIALATCWAVIVPSIPTGRSSTSKPSLASLFSVCRTA